MSPEKTGCIRTDKLSERSLSVIVFSLFFSWLLAFPFEGQILYALADYRHTPADQYVFGTLFAHFAGLISCGFFIKTMKTVKKLIIFSIIFCIFTSGVFFFPPSFLWTTAILSSSFLSGSCVAAWGFYFKSGTPKNERIKTAAEGLIFSNTLMILLNMTAVYLSPQIGLGFSMLTLFAALLFAFRLPTESNTSVPPAPAKPEHTVRIIKPLAFLCLFIVVITINSGLMYHVLNPAYEHLEWLTSWYWAIPYIAALFIMKKLPRKTNRTYILYVAVAMIGFSFIAFMSLDRSPASYLVVNTLMLGACGVYDLFWWSILGEMLELDKNPAKVLGIGLSANVLGVLMGGLIGTAVTSVPVQSHTPTLLALGVVCVIFVMLDPLHRRLTLLLRNHAYLTMISEMPPQEQDRLICHFSANENLTEREKEIAALLLGGKTYKMIAAQLHVSENTVKTHVKNIYSKASVQNRMELMIILMDKKAPSGKSRVSL